MPYDISYEYDAAGNRIRKVDNLTAAVTTYTYDAANQLQTEQTAAVTTTYTFDRAGNMETITKPVGQVTTYVWDAENRRTAVQTSGGAVEATYNADGLRIQNGDRTFLWDGQAYLAETDLAGDVRTLYTVQPSRYGRLISQKRSSTTGSECFHFDALGSTVSISEAGERYIYDAWGNLLSSNSFKPAFLFAGEHGYYADGDDFGGYYVRARYYSGRHSRFLTIDPSRRFRKALYQYARNRPVLYIDASGLVECQPPSGVQYITGRGRFNRIELVPKSGMARLGFESTPGFVEALFLLEWQSYPEAFRADDGSCCCCNIGFVQMVSSEAEYSSLWDELFVDASTQGQWELDGTIPYGATKDFGDVEKLNRSRENVVSTGNPCTLKGPIGMQDSPGNISDGLERLEMNFQTCVVCLGGGPEAPSIREPRAYNPGKLEGMAVYGCVSWVVRWSRGRDDEFVAVWLDQQRNPEGVEPRDKMKELLDQRLSKPPLRMQGLGSY